MNKLLKSLSAIIALIAVAPITAAQWYQVEVIVFDYTSPDLDGELWFENPGLPPRGDSIELITAVPDATGGDLYAINQALLGAAPDAEPADTRKAEPVPYLVLPQANYRLRDDYRRLQLSSAYRPLLHVAWQQPGLGANEVRYVHLQRLAQSTVNPATLSSTPADGQAGEDFYAAPEPILDGLIRVRSTDLLYVDVDLAYFPENFQRLLESQSGMAAGEKNRLVNFAAGYVRMTQNRRIRLNELHFFDHPLFGILVQVSRIHTDS